MKNYAIILAAGLGSRMKVDEPKCVHHIIKKPMIQYIVESVDKEIIDTTLLVIGKNHLEKFSSILNDEVSYVIQEKQLGTGNAVSCCLSQIKDLKGNTIIFPGDIPLINKEEIKAIKKACGDKILKVIIETCLLSDEEKIEMCKIVTEAGADFIKTSTGFGTRGVSLEDVLLINEHKNEVLEIKASGGIKTYKDAIKYIEKGVNRIGTSNGVKIMEGDK